MYTNKVIWYVHYSIYYIIDILIYYFSYQTQYYKLYRRIFPALLRLCTSTEPVSKQLFRPLFSQLIFWFTKNQQYENTDTMTLLDAIIDAVGNTEDGGLREFSAECLSYFMQCSLESASNQSEESPLNVKSLFKRLYSLAHHPEPYKRIGCALTFNKVYRIFRTTEVIVDQFIFEIQSNLLFSLRLANKDDPSMKTQEIISSAVKNITRIIVAYAKAGKLIKEDSKRREFSSLSDFIDREIFIGTNRPEEACREECMSIFIQVTPYLSGIKSPLAWVQKKLQIESIQWLLNEYEGSSSALNLGSIPQSTELQAFYVKLTSLVDSYMWMFSEEFIEPSILLAGKQKSCLFTKIAIFIDNYALAGCDRVLSKDSMNDISVSCLSELSPHELKVYNGHKTKLIVRIFRLFSLLLEKYPEFHIPEDLFENQTFYEVLLCSILAPSWIGYAYSESSTNDVLKKLCSVLDSKLPSPKKNILNETLKQFLKNPKLNILTLTKQNNNNPIDVQSAASLVDGYRLLYQTKILRNSRFNKFTSTLSNRLFSDLFNNCFNYSPSQLLVGRNIFSLCEELKVDYELLLKCLLDDEIIMENNEDIIVPEGSTIDEGEVDFRNMIKNSGETKGSVFYHHFTEQICELVFDNFNNCIETIIQHCKTGNNIMWALLFGIIEFITKQNRYSTEFLSKLIKNLKELEKLYSGANSTYYFKENLLELCKRILNLNTSIIDDFEAFGFFESAFVFLSKDDSLTQKTKPLEILPPLLSVKGKDISKLTDVVNDLLIYSFPSKFSDIPKGCTMYSEIQICLERLLSSLIQSKNLKLLEKIIPLLRYEEEHPFTNIITKGFKDFVEQLPEDNALEVFNFSISELNDSSHKDQLRLAITNQLCVPVLHRLSVNGCVQAVSPYISSFMQTATNPLSLHLQSPETNITDITYRTCILLLIQAIFDVIPSKTIKEQLNKLFCPSESSKKNELTTAIMRATHSAKSKIVEGDHGVPASTVLRYQRTAYNALVSVVVCTQTNPSFFTVFFFKENKAKGEYIWNNIIDTEVSLINYYYNIFKVLLIFIIH